MLSCLLFITLSIPINMASGQVSEGKLVALADSKDQKSTPVEEEEEDDDDC